MKTKLTFACLALSISAMAQVSNLPTVLNINTDDDDKSTYEMFGVVPSSLSYDGTNRVYIRTADDQVAIYTNSFTPVKQFNISANMEGVQHRGTERTVTVTVTGGELINQNIAVWDGDLQLIEINGSYDVPATWGETEIKNFLESDQNSWKGSWGGGAITTIKPQPNGGTWFIYDMDAYEIDGRDNGNYWNPDTYGKQYPKSAYLWRNGYLYLEYNIGYSDESQYSEKQVSFSYGEWTETGEVNEKTDIQTWGIGFLNYDNDQLIFNSEDGDGLCLTQTLFNEDEQYEYLYFPISSYVLSESGYPEEPICYDCYNESTTYTQSGYRFYQASYSGFNVMSETGSTLQSVSFPSGFVMKRDIHAQIIKLSDEYYIICTGEMNDNAAMLVYKINRTNTGTDVQQVSAPIKIAAYPSPANRNQTITVNLGGNNKTATELQVVNMNGQVLDRRTIPAGQQQTTLPASRFAPGTNLINATQNGHPVGTTRVIVK